jgi:hypothetical protein
MPWLQRDCIERGIGQRVGEKADDKENVMWKSIWGKEWIIQQKLKPNVPDLIWGIEYIN